MSHYSISGHDGDGYSFNALIPTHAWAETVYQNLRETMPQDGGFGLQMAGPVDGDIEHEVVSASGPNRTLLGLVTMLVQCQIELAKASSPGKAK